MTAALLIPNEGRRPLKRVEYDKLVGVGGSDERAELIYGSCGLFTAGVTHMSLWLSGRRS